MDSFLDYAVAKVQSSWNELRDFLLNRQENTVVTDSKWVLVGPHENTIDLLSAYLQKAGIQLDSIAFIDEQVTFTFVRCEASIEVNRSNLWQVVREYLRDEFEDFQETIIDEIEIHNLESGSSVVLIIENDWPFIGSRFDTKLFVKDLVEELGLSVLEIGYQETNNDCDPNIVVLHVMILDEFPTVTYESDLD